MEYVALCRIVLKWNNHNRWKYLSTSTEEPNYGGGGESTRFDQKVNSGFSYHVMEKPKRAFGQPHSNLSIRTTLICDSSLIFTPPISFSLHMLHFRKMWPRGLASSHLRSQSRATISLQEGKINSLPHPPQPHAVEAKF